MTLLIALGRTGLGSLVKDLKGLPVGSANLDLDSLEMIPASCHFSISIPLLSRVYLRWKTRTAIHHILIDMMPALCTKVKMAYRI